MNITIEKPVATNRKQIKTEVFTKNAHQHNMLMAVLLVFTFIIFSSSLRNEILIGWDDGEYLTNPVITNSAAGAGSQIFSDFHLGMYQPLSVLSFLFNYKISSHPASFILVNILLHLLNTWLVFKLLMRLLSKFEVAFITTLLFAIHPMHVEPVVWISTRSSLLYSVFFLAGLIQYLKYIKEKTSKNYILTLLFALLALFSKSMAATFPLILILIDYLKGRKLSFNVIKEKVPFFIMSIIFGLIAIKAADSFGHITVLEEEYSIIKRVVLIIYGISFYMVKLILPVNLSTIYAFPNDGSGNFPGWIYAPMLSIVVLAIVLLRSRDNRKLFIFGALFFISSISMVLPLFWSRIFITADRYTYIPYIGLMIIIATGIAYLHDQQKIMQKSTQNMLLFTTVLILLFVIWGTEKRIKVWHDVPTLMTDVIDNQRSDADMAFAYFYLGNYYDVNGSEDDALKNYNLAISRNPNYLLAYNNRAIIKGKNGNSGGAVTDLTKAINIKPNYAEAWYNRGVAYYQLHENDKACNDWQKASSLGFKEADKVISTYCRQ